MKNGKNPLLRGRRAFTDDPLDSFGGVAVCHVRNIAGGFCTFWRKQGLSTTCACARPACDVVEEALGKYMVGRYTGINKKEDIMISVKKWMSPNISFSGPQNGNPFYGRCSGRRIYLQKQKGNRSRFFRRNGVYNCASCPDAQANGSCRVLSNAPELNGRQATVCLHGCRRECARTGSRRQSVSFCL
jgi:hypothetical protein